MLKLYGTRKSRAFRCLWMLEECGADYTLEPADFATEDVVDLGGADGITSFADLIANHVEEKLSIQIRPSASQSVRKRCGSVENPVQRL